jgi:hypothetical protein
VKKRAKIANIDGLPVTHMTVGKEMILLLHHSCFSIAVAGLDWSSCQ